MVDATLGEGGHTEAFLELFPDLHVYGVDADGEIQQRARTRLGRFEGRVTFYRGWFDAFFREYPGNTPPDRILLDLGISMYHFSEASRGFSFAGDDELDMRLDRTVGASAADLVNAATEEELAGIVFTFGEDRFARRIARRIVAERRRAPITTARRLADVVAGAVAGPRRGRIHPATRTFQALRIAVNDELGRLRRALPAAVHVLAPGGRIGVISFHSLEDRIVKRFFRGDPTDERENLSIELGNTPILEEKAEYVVRPITKKPITPSEDEIRRNSASRSAKFRVAEKVIDDGTGRPAESSGIEGRE